MRKGLKVWKFVCSMCLVSTLLLPMAPEASAQGARKEPAREKSGGKGGIDPAASKDATAHTVAANAKVRQDLNTLFGDTYDFEAAKTNWLFKPEVLQIPNKLDPTKLVWNLEPFKGFITDRPAPPTINPSLYRNAQLNMIYGLFRVTDDIYQVRGYDLSNITFVRSTGGWIVFDPLTSYETAAAALQLINDKVQNRPVVAVIYSHSHIDHYGGVRAMCPNPVFETCNIQVIAPEGFTEHAVSENVIAGNAMSRRALYMYGALLPPGEKGLVNSGLGQTNSTGEATLVLPTETITATGQTKEIGGVKMEFQLTPGTEAPAEMNTWFPDWKAMWMAENTTNTFHNVLTLRGAQVRDPLKWSSFLDETIDRYGAEVQVKFQSHHWPIWGHDRIIEYWKKQRDLYKYTHDQSVNLMNKGYTGEEISEMIHFPPSLDQFWPNRGYYGTLRHNSRAVYQRYMGWYDGNPSDLNNLPPEDVAKKYVEYMGGSAAILARAKAKDGDLEKGEYRWLAEVLKHVVFAEPKNQEARYLLADVLEQLGYQAESGPWRNVYLVGAYELRSPALPTGGLSAASPDTIAAMTPEMVFDYLSVRLNGPKVWNWSFRMNLQLTGVPTEDPGDSPTATEDRELGVDVENAVLHYRDGFFPTTPTAPDVTVKMSKATLDALQTGTLKPQDAIDQEKVEILDGDQTKFLQFWDNLDTFELWFNIVTP